MKRLLAAAGILAVALAAVAYAFASSGSKSSSGVFGRAVVGGPCPVSLEVQLRCSERPIRATIAVMERGSSPKRVATLHSNRAGRFRGALAAGKYRLVPHPFGSAHAAPINVEVPADQFVRVNVRYRASNR